MVSWDWVVELGLGRHGNIKILWIDGDILHRSPEFADLTAEDSYPDPISQDQFWNLTAGDIAISRVAHLLAGRQVAPELESVHASVPVAFWHFLMNDTAACSHPLDIT